MLGARISDPEIVALNSWTRGLEALVQGRMDDAIAALNESHARFLAVDNQHEAAATQVSKLVALAMPTWVLVWPLGA